MSKFTVVDKNGTETFDIFDAIISGEYDEIEEYLNSVKAGKNVVPDPQNALDGEGRTPMYVAAKYGCKEIIQLLKDHGHPINQPCGKDGRTPLHAACDNDHADACSVLMWLSELKDTICTIARYPTKDIYGNTALHLAVQNRGDTRLVRMLLRHDFPVDAPDNFGRTALHYCGPNDTEMIKTLLHYGADINLVNSNVRADFLHTLDVSREVADPMLFNITLTGLVIILVKLGLVAFYVLVNSYTWYRTLCAIIAFSASFVGVSSYITYHTTEKNMFPVDIQMIKDSTMLEKTSRCVLTGIPFLVLTAFE
jgi:Ankyrin repeats (3 copies)/Ankyrin repeats (many copies)